MNFMVAKEKEVTLGFQLANHPNRYGLYPVMMRITKDRKTKRVRTEIEVKKSDWNQNAKNRHHIRCSCLNSKALNLQLDEIYNEYKQKYLELQKSGEVTQDTLIDKVSEAEPSFLKFAKEVSQGVYDAGRFRDWKKHNGFLNKLTLYLETKGKKDLLFSELKISLLRDFDHYLHKLHNEINPEKMLNPNTIYEYLRMFKRLVNKAVAENMLKVDDNPFLRCKDLTKEVKTKKEKLDISEIEKIKSLDLEKGSLIWHCRNYFLFSFYCCGIRVGDFIPLKWCNIVEDGNRLLYEMNKNHKVVNIKLTDEAKEILSYYSHEKNNPIDYIFPLLNNKKVWAKYVSQEEKDTMPPDMKINYLQAISSKNALINKELAKIKELAGISKHLSFHIARHSFASVARENGVSNNIIQKMLNHSKLETTERYMGNFDTEQVDEALDSIFEHKDDGHKDIISQLKKLDPKDLETIIAQVKSN